MIVFDVQFRNRAAKPGLEAGMMLACFALIVVDGLSTHSTDGANPTVTNLSPSVHASIFTVCLLIQQEINAHAAWMSTGCSRVFCTVRNGPSTG